MSEAMIRLEGVGKTYPGTETPAVADLTLEIQQGEVLVLVGPSGCGKSTTLRLINRMIEPTSGTIWFDGEDVTKVDPDKLRRRIGYVIQQIGLFPHQTIAQNVATVPRMLGWKKKETRERVDELLHLTGLDPAVYRDRYPKELSGGQAQRVGVARALGADPEVMLMDEPFGAIDPITRDRLQNEFLRLLDQLGKTIVFVTHDIDEALKMGDRIAILGEQSKIQQIDSPARILAYPVNEFVDDFIGSGSTLKGLNFEHVSDVEFADYPTMAADEDPARALAEMETTGHNWALITDGDGRPIRWARKVDLQRPADLTVAGNRIEGTIEANSTLHDALEQMVTSQSGCCCVVDGQGALQGVITLRTLIAVIQQLETEAREHYESEESVA
jgi:osmoprotectant transport system ATP-binding protein